MAGCLEQEIAPFDGIGWLPVVEIVVESAACHAGRSDRPRDAAWAYLLQIRGILL